MHADFWDWWHGAEFKWEKGADAEQDGEADGQEEAPAAAGSAPAAAQQQAGAAVAATSSGDEYGEVSKQLHSAVEHVQPPGSPAAHSSPGAGNQQQFVAGVDLQIPFRCAKGVGHCLGPLAGRVPLVCCTTLCFAEGAAEHQHSLAVLCACMVEGNRRLTTLTSTASMPCSLRSADDLRTPFTNYVKGYQGLLDYIW